MILDGVRAVVVGVVGPVVGPVVGAVVGALGAVVPVIAPADRPGWTRDIHRASRRLALGVRAELAERGLPFAAHIAGGDALAFRGDPGTLNLADVPSVVAELGNMRDAADARRMTSRAGRATYAAALVAAILGYLR